MDLLEEQKAVIRELKKDANDRCKAWINDIQNQKSSYNYAKKSKRADFVKKPAYVTNSEQ